VTVYFISGLGADKRAFKNIKLPDKFEIIHIDWLSPLDNETLTEYCLRLSDKIDRQKPFVLIGLSFGGIVVAELSKSLKPNKSIIISSASSSKQLPWFYKAIGWLRVHKLIPVALLKSANRLTFWAFGIKTADEKILITQILKDIDKVYLKWAINEILNWRSNEKPRNLLHIHGTDDNILPIRFVQPDIRINGGRHLMVLSMSDTINEILKTEMAYL
jgi:pimeloyl-ACP methyl ester carboxylesterase